jgi:8-oxo-dGTP diphosphatase
MPELPQMKTDPEIQPTRVAIAIVRRGNEFLIRVRPPGGPMPGVYEFAGGKCEPGESPDETALREAHEEMGMEVTILRLRTEFEYHYAHGHIHLHYFDAEPAPLNAEPAPETGFHWVHGSVLPTLTFPPANEPIMKALADEVLSTFPDTRSES